MEPIIIGIAGGSGSGKSTFTNRLRQYFGDDVVVIYHDNYYRRQDGIPFEQRVKVNYDHPDSLETDLLVEHLKELKAGKTIECPVDYSQHNRSSEIIKIEPRPIILVEGILLLADERIRSLLDIKVYVEADADERILRRIVRDVEERGRDLKGIITQYLTTVKPMHYMYVEPTRALADIVINSGRTMLRSICLFRRSGSCWRVRKIKYEYVKTACCQCCAGDGRSSFALRGRTSQFCVDALAHKNIKPYNDCTVNVFPQNLTGKALKNTLY